MWTCSINWVLELYCRDLFWCVLEINPFPYLLVLIIIFN